MAKITGVSPNIEQRIKELEKYKGWWDRDSRIHDAEDKRIRGCPEIQSIISLLEYNIGNVRRATTPKTMQKNFDILLIRLMKTAYDLSKSTRPRLKNQIDSLKHKILLDIAYMYANAAKKKSKK